MKIRIFKLWFRFFLFRLENNHKLIIKNHCILNQVVKHLIKSVHHQFLNMNWVIYEKSNTYISSFNIWSHSFSTPVAVWRAAYCKRFPQEVSRKKKECISNLDLIIFTKGWKTWSIINARLWSWSCVCRCLDRCNARTKASGKWIYYQKSSCSMFFFSP